MATAKYTPIELQRARNYAREEPGFTAPFMAWELGWSLKTAKAVTARLLADGYIYEVEPASRPHPAVYAHKRPKHLGDSGAPRFYLEGQGDPEADLAARRGHIVPHTRYRGQSDTPGATRKRQQRGVRIKRQKNGT